MAVAEGGDFLVRIEDIDQSRARPEWEALIFEDLAWLGLTWSDDVIRQSDRLTAYTDALERLWDKGLLYPCDCSRRDIAEALAAPQEGVEPSMGPDGPVYPGTCRHKADRTGPMPRGAVLRLDMDRAVGPGLECVFTEAGIEAGRIEATADELVTQVGDIVLARRDMGTSYHLSVVLDDAAQGITHVVRGQDLFEATKIHVVLQRLLGLPTPTYHHHRLIRDAAGKRLAKRDDARAIRTYRDEGLTPNDIRRLVALPASSSG